MLETNVHGLIRMTRLCLPSLLEGGHLVNIGSVAGRQAYENGSLYVTSKFAVRGFTYALREDLLGKPVRITTVDPGLVATDFSRVRFRGDEEQARSVYEGVEAMTPDDIAACIVFALTRPAHVNVDELVVKALAQSSGGRIIRVELMLHDPRGLDVLHLRRPRRRRRGDERLLRARHSLPLGARADDQRRAAAAALLGAGRVLLRGVLPPQPARRRAAAGHALDLARRRFVGEGMQERIMLRNEGMEPVSFELGLEIGRDFADIMSVKEHDFALGDPDPRAAAAAARRSRATTTSTTSSCSPTPRSAARTQVILSQRGATDGSGITLPVELAPARVPGSSSSTSSRSIDGERGRAAARRAALRRRARARPRLARGVAATRAAAPRRAGTTSSTRSASRSSDLASLRMRSATESRTWAAARRGDAVVHDRLRPRHDHHVPADAALRPGARAQGARGARRASGARGRPVDRRGAGEDRPRGAHRQGREALVPRRTTARSTRRRSTSCCSPRSGAGRTTPRSCSS